MMRGVCLTSFSDVVRRYGRAPDSLARLWLCDHHSAPFGLGRDCRDLAQRTRLVGRAALTGHRTIPHEPPPLMGFDFRAITLTKEM